MDPGPALTELLIHQCCFAVLGTGISATIRNVCKTVCKNVKPTDKPFFLKASPDRIKQAVKPNYQGRDFLSTPPRGSLISKILTGNFKVAALGFMWLFCCCKYFGLNKNTSKTHFFNMIPKEAKGCWDFPVRFT